MVVGAGGYLRQMGDGQHLAVVTKLAHQATHFVRDSAAHTGIHFVKNQGGDLFQQTAGDGNGQGNARKFAA